MGDYNKKLLEGMSEEEKRSLGLTDRSDAEVVGEALEFEFTAGREAAEEALLSFLREPSGEIVEMQFAPGTKWFRGKGYCT